MFMARIKQREREREREREKYQCRMFSTNRKENVNVEIWGMELAFKFGSRLN